MAAPLMATDWELRSVVEQGYDSNVFQTGEGSPADRSSWVTRLSPELRWDAGAGSSVFYRMEAELFWSESSEDSVRHHLGFRHAGENDRLSYRISSTQLRVQGPSDAVTYDGGRNAYATAAVRERRDQWQNRSQAQLTWQATERSFIRARSSLLYYDLDSAIRSIQGYDNYINRYDVNGAVDWGWNLADGSVGYIGLQRGYQHQGRQGGRLGDRSNHYNRLLVGWAGSLHERLSFDLELGPSRHEYSFAPGPERTTRLFINGSVSFDVTDSDRLELRLARRKFVASTGRLSNEITNATLSWLGEPLTDWSFRLQGQARGLEYDGVNTRDWVYTLRLNIDHTHPSGLRAGLQVERSFGRDEAQSRPGRTFNRSWIGLTLNYDL